MTQPTRRAVLALGSNQGDRPAMLQGAVDALSRAGRVLAVSPVYETDPVGGPEQADYLNAVVVVATDLTAHDLLALAHDVESAYGRVRVEHWGPRTLDVDVVAVGDEQVADDDLVVPHPRLRERAFVLVPWLDVEPGAVLPDGTRVADLAAAVGSTGVRPRPDVVLQVGAERGS